MSELPSFQERLTDLSARLAEHGSLGLVLLDLSPLGQIEDEYGAETYQEVRSRAFDLLAEERGKGYRGDDLLALDQPHGLRVLLFLGHKRRRAAPPNLTDVRLVATRAATSLMPALARCAFPYLKSPAGLEVGHALAIHNPLVHTDRLVRRACTDALETAAHQRQGRRLQMRERLLDILQHERIATAFQPIVRTTDRTVLAFEALSRGPRGSGLEAPDVLFGAASEHLLLIELDRLCRRRALLAAGRIPSNSKLFVNTLPATIRDPGFRGKALIDFLDRAQISPDRIVLEITEKLMIENYSLFRETMAYFTALGMAFAVDDVGAGYSGLESIARLKPAYLKIDMALVRDLPSSLVNREMVKAIVALGRGIGALVVAEGIEQQAELETLEALGVTYGQGYLLARPEVGTEAK